MSLPIYPKYKPSGVEWLGKVPEHWEVKRLVAFFDERREKVSDKDFPALSVTKNGIVPQIDTAAKTDDGDNRKKVCAGDFVINSRSDRNGSSGVSPLDGSVSLINSVLEPTNAIVGGFVHHLLRSQQFQEEYYRYGKGIVADLWSTNYSEMRNILLAIPTKPEQAKIAAFLGRETGKIDALVEEQRRLIELLKEKRQAVISHAVTKGLDPHAKMKPSGMEWLGEVPAHWDLVPLRFLVQFISGGTPDKKNASYWDGTIPWVSSKDMKIEEIADAEDHVSEEAVIESGLKIIPAGHIVVVVRGMILAHSFPVAITLGDITINQDLKALKCVSELTPLFLRFLFEGITAYIVANADESAHGTKKLDTEMLGKLPILVPPVAEQNRIIAELRREIGILEGGSASAHEAIDLLQERRTALISAAVTGKIDVRGVRHDVQ